MRLCEAEGLDLERPMSAQQVEALERALRQDHYTPEQLAQLLDMDEYVIRSAVWAKELPAQVLGTAIVSVERADALVWLRQRR